MKTHFEITYDKYALIAEIASRSSSLGRTALQKHLYLLQTLFNVNVGYDFTLYTYGPFTSEILSDLDAAEEMKAVQVNVNASSYGGYTIKPGSEFERIKSKASVFLDQIHEQLDALIKEFGSFNSKELELRATIVYADKDMQKVGRPVNELFDTVHEIKPGFSSQQIESAISELKQKAYIRTN